MLHEHVKARIHLVSLCNFVSLCNSINNIESKTDLQLFYINLNFACFFYSIFIYSPNIYWTL